MPRATATGAREGRRGRPDRQRLWGALGGVASNVFRHTARGGRGGPGQAPYQSEPGRSPDLGVQTACHVGWVTPADTPRTLPSARPTCMVPECAVWATVLS